MHSIISSLLQELHSFIQNVVSFVGTYQFAVDISEVKKEDQVHQVLSNIVLAVETFPMGGLTSFPIVSIDLRAVQDGAQYYRRLLDAPIIQNTRWLTVCINNPVELPIINEYKRWLYIVPSQMPKIGEIERSPHVLHLKDLDKSLEYDIGQNVFWTLFDPIITVKNFEILCYILL